MNEGFSFIISELICVMRTVQNVDDNSSKKSYLTNGIYSAI